MFRHSLKQSQFRSAQQVLTLALMGVLVANVSLAPTAAASPQVGTPIELSQASSPSRQVIRRVSRDLAERFSVPQRSLKLVGSSRETWSNSCLGLEAPNERCAGVQVEGWRIEMTDGQQNWVYRTNLTAEVLRPEPNAAALPPEVSEKLLGAIAKQARVSISSLRVAESKVATWDGCMGIYEPGRACIQIAISGWRVIVAGDKQSWVYHVSTDGSRIVQNATASGSRVVPSFATADESPFGQPEAQIVFRSIESGGFAGMVAERVLMSDGTLYHQVHSMSDSTTEQRRAIVPVIEKRLSARQVQRFQALLETQRFPNLNHLRYLSDAAFADYPTITLQAMGSSVEYIDLEADHLPGALQRVVRAWNRL
jgi:hypothetical protein